MGQSLKKRQFKIWRKNRSNKVKNQKRVTANSNLLRELRDMYEKWAAKL